MRKVNPLKTTREPGTVHTYATIMQLVDLFPTAELAREDSADLFNGGEYPVWSPYDAADAAATLRNYFGGRSHLRGPERATALAYPVYQ